MSSMKRRRPGQSATRRNRSPLWPHLFLGAPVLFRPPDQEQERDKSGNQFHNVTMPQRGEQRVDAVLCAETRGGAHRCRRTRLHCHNPATSSVHIGGRLGGITNFPIVGLGYASRKGIIRRRGTKWREIPGNIACTPSSAPNWPPRRAPRS